MEKLMNKARLFAAFILVAGLFSVFTHVKHIEAYQTHAVLSGSSDASTNALYVGVKNADDVAHEIGDVVVWNDGTDDGVEVTTTTTANHGLVAGVVALKDIPASGLGLVQVAGYHSAVTVAVATSAGDTLVTSTTGEAATTYTLAMATGSLTNEATTLGPFAVAFEATTTSTTVKAIIRAL